MRSGDHLSSPDVTDGVKRPTRRSNETGRLSRLLGLAPGGVCLAAAVTSDAGALLPHRFTLARSRSCGHSTSLWHFSVGLPRLAVSQHRALWSADFPHPGNCQGRDRPVDLITSLLYHATQEIQRFPRGPGGRIRPRPSSSRSGNAARIASIARSWLRAFSRQIAPGDCMSAARMSSAAAA